MPERNVACFRYRLRNIRWRLPLTLGALLTATASSPAQANPLFINLGVHASEIDARIANEGGWRSQNEAGLHLGIGASKRSGDNEYGVRLELDDMGSDLMLSVRAFDYQRHISEKLALGGFVGAARLDLATPAYGYYLGGSVRVKQVVPGWSLDISVRFGDKVARDNLLPDDPQGGSPDNFYDVTGVAVSLQKRF